MVVCFFVGWSVVCSCVCLLVCLFVWLCVDWIVISLSACAVASFAGCVIGCLRVSACVFVTLVGLCFVSELVARLPGCLFVSVFPCVCVCRFGCLLFGLACLFARRSGWLVVGWLVCGLVGFVQECSFACVVACLCGCMLVWLFGCSVACLVVRLFARVFVCWVMLIIGGYARLRVWLFTNVVLFACLCVWLRVCWLVG